MLWSSGSLHFRPFLSLFISGNEAPPLLSAVSNGHERIAALLLAARAELRGDGFGRTPLWEAATKGGFRGSMGKSQGNPWEILRDWKLSRKIRRFCREMLRTAGFNFVKFIDIHQGLLFNHVSWWDNQSRFLELIVFT